MKNYEIIGTTTIVKLVELQAETIEDAIKFANGLGSEEWDEGKEKIDDYTVISVKEIE